MKSIGKKFNISYIGLHTILKNNPSDILSKYFMDYVDRIGKVPIIKQALVLGYLVRLTEENISNPNNKTVKYQKPIADILKSGYATKDTLEKLTNYFDNHNMVGPGEPIKPYTILKFNKIMTIFEIIVEDFIKSNFEEYSGELNKKLFYELITRNATVGYQYRTAEYILDNKGIHG